MKIVHLGPGGAAGRGGIGRTMAYAVQAAEHTPDIELSVIDTYGSHGAAWTPFVFGAACARLVMLALTQRVDAVHIHMSQGGSIARKLTLLLIAKTCGVPAVLHIHGSRFALFVDAMPRALRPALIWIIARADRIIVIARPLERFALEIGLPRERVVLIHNGVPDRGARPIGAAAGAPVTLLALGELGTRKGTDDIIAALSRPPLRALSWRAVLAGNGAVDVYRAKIAAAGLHDRIAVPGWVDAAEVGRLLDGADILLLPSYNEGLPLAILEGLATGIPVISTPVGGIADAVIDGETGLMVPPGAPEALAAAIARLILDKDLRLKLGQNGRRLFLDHFDISATFAKVAALYRGLCAGLGFSSP